MFHLCRFLFPPPLTLSCTNATCSSSLKPYPSFPPPTVAEPHHTARLYGVHPSYRVMYFRPWKHGNLPSVICYMHYLPFQSLSGPKRYQSFDSGRCDIWCRVSWRTFSNMKVVHLHPIDGTEGRQRCYFQVFLTVTCHKDLISLGSLKHSARYQLSVTDSDSVKIF